MSSSFTTDPATTLNLHRRHIETSALMALVSSGLVFLAFLEEQQRKVMLECCAFPIIPVGQAP